MVKAALFFLPTQMHHRLKALLSPTPPPIYIGNAAHLFQSNTHQILLRQPPRQFPLERITNNKNHR
ncbi:hypothetical protein LXL04_015487 [Taraxacum kok-saghyz]